MTVQELLFWVAIGILVGAIILLVGNQLLINLLKVTVEVKPS
jgi:hypothetical protein